MSSATLGREARLTAPTEESAKPLRESARLLSAVRVEQRATDRASGGERADARTAPGTDVRVAAHGPLKHADEKSGCVAVPWELELDPLISFAMATRPGDVVSR
jgi:hypothetical protein